MQPRSQGFSSPHPRESEGRETLVPAGHVPPKKWEVKKKKTTTGGKRNRVAKLTVES